MSVSDLIRFESEYGPLWFDPDTVTGIRPSKPGHAVVITAAGMFVVRGTPDQVRARLLGLEGSAPFSGEDWGVVAQGGCGV